MYTSFVLFALTATAADESLTWMDSYPQARKVSAEKNRPLAVFLGEGKTGYNRVVREGLNAETRRLLTENYLAVFIDTSTQKGKMLAEQFEMPGGQGIVISNRNGQLQAFRHAGELTNTQLSTRLQRYSDTNRVVRTTDTLTSGRTSFYSGPGADQQGYFGQSLGQQGYYGPGVGQQGYYPNSNNNGNYGNSRRGRRRNRGN